MRKIKRRLRLLAQQKQALHHLVDARAEAVATGRGSLEKISDPGPVAETRRWPVA